MLDTTMRDRCCSSSSSSDDNDAMWSSRMDYLRTVAFPRAAADGAFGPGAEYVSFCSDDRGGATAAGDQFASDIVFGTVTLTGCSEWPTGDVPVVVKFKNADARMSAMMNMHQKFYNEYVFYAHLLPELSAHAADPAAAFALFPRFLYSNATLDGGLAGEQMQAIVLASLAPAGYRAADQRVFVDVEHALLAFRKLGALHGLSYNVKAGSRGGEPTFADLCTAALVETQWFDEHWFKSPRFLSGTGNRGVNALRDSDTRGEYAAPLARVQATLSGESAAMAALLRPVEPLAVLCHGDFCRNNLLYRYDAATGRPADVAVLDPAQARYASPAVDLSFFLYMNTSDADRTANWDRYVAAYLDGVADVTPTGRPAPLTAADVHAEMRQHGLYGYAHCSFFLPAMVNAEPPDVQRLTTCTADERIELINESGGWEADRLLASIVRHMADRGYV